MDPQTPDVPVALTAYLGLFLAGSLWAWIRAVGRIRRGRPLLPTTPARSVPWGSGSVLLVALLYLGLMILVPAVLHPFFSANPPDQAGATGFSPEEMLLIVAVVNAAVIVTVPLVLTWTTGARPDDLGLSMLGIGPEIGRGLVACLLLAPPVYVSYGLAMAIWGQRPHLLEQMIRADPSPTSILLAVVSGVVLAPVAEELLFRGVLQGWLTSLWERPNSRASHADPDPSRESTPTSSLKLPPPITDDPDLAVTHSMFGKPAQQVAPDQRPGPSLSGRSGSAPSLSPIARNMPNILTSTLFAITHAPQWPAPVAIFLLSLGLGTIYRSSGRLVGPIVLHLAFNGSSTLLLFLSLLGR